MSVEQALARLAAAAGASTEQLKSFAALTPLQIDQLAQAIGHADRKQAADLDAAIEGGLSHVPALLRGTVKKILLG